MKNLLCLLSLSLVLAACGGGNGGDPGALPQPHSPVLVDPGTISVPEMTRDVTKISVSSPDGNNVKLSLTGPDASLFSISGDGSIRFAIAPNYLAPADANKDNV